jgi:DNA-binding MarR family transcriptional regulator
MCVYFTYEQLGLLMADRIEIQSMSRDELVVSLPKLLVTAGELAQKAGDQLVFEDFELTSAKYSVLRALQSRGGSPTMTELKNHIMRSSANLTQLIDSLERDGLVARVPAPGDRRSYLIELTRKGRSRMAKVDAYMLEQMREYLKDYSDEDLRVFIRLIGRFTVDCFRLLKLDDTNSPLWV